MAWDFKLLCAQKADVSEAMSVLGNAGPTVNRAEKMVKGGYVDDDGGWCKAYYTADDLRRMSVGMAIVAEWLENRALSDQPDSV